MKTLITVLQCLLLVFSLMSANTSSVYADDDHDRARELREAGEILPLETIVAQVQARGLGRVLEVELKTKHDRYVYELEVIDSQGMVWELQFDARSGQQLRQKQEDD